MNNDGHYIYVGRQRIENYSLKSTELPDGQVIDGIEIRTDHFYNKIGKLADPYEGLVAIVGGERYPFRECNEKRTIISAGDASYELPLKRMDIAALLSEVMLEEYGGRGRTQLAHLLVGAGGQYFTDRRKDYATRAVFQSSSK